MIKYLQEKLEEKNNIICQQKNDMLEFKSVSMMNKFARQIQEQNNEIRTLTGDLKFYKSMIVDFKLKKEKDTTKLNKKIINLEVVLFNKAKGIVEANKYIDDLTENNNKIKTLYKKLSDDNETLKNNTKYKKKVMPSSVKRLVWNKYIGERNGKASCYCCRITEIRQMSFHCGHVEAERRGGETTLKNLRPICQNCNSSMGSMNMNDFIKQHGLHEENNRYDANDTNEINEDKITCECGAKIVKHSLRRHRETQKHKDLMEKNKYVF